jgi:hypothetical protein
MSLKNQMGGDTRVVDYFYDPEIGECALFAPLLRL